MRLLQIAARVAASDENWMEGQINKYGDKIIETVNDLNSDFNSLAERVEKYLGEAQNLSDEDLASEGNQLINELVKAREKHGKIWKFYIGDNVFREVLKRNNLGTPSDIERMGFKYPNMIGEINRAMMDRHRVESKGPTVEDVYGGDPKERPWGLGT
jgi:hypothetical protein